MKKTTCRDFEKALDEWVSGTLPDYRRPAMAKHEAKCAECHALAGDSRRIVHAAQEEELELPGEAYFDDLRWRLEEELEREGAWEPPRQRTPVRRARLLSFGQAAALFFAILSTSIWAGTAWAVFTYPGEGGSGTSAALHVASSSILPEGERELNMEEMTFEKEMLIKYIFSEDNDAQRLYSNLL